jgi:Domain of unknown function DUF11
MFVWLLLCGSFAWGAQDDVKIEPDPIECWPTDEFLIVHSGFVPIEDVQSAKFYFRSIKYPDYYFVDLELSPGGGSAVVPKASPDTGEVAYYVELLTPGYAAFRTEEKTAPVSTSTECKRRDPAALFFKGQNPNIVVNAVRPGAPPLPPGFQADGILGPAVSGGGSAKTVGILAGAGGGAVAAIVLSKGGGSDSSSSSSASTSTSAASSSSTSTSVVGATSSTTTTATGTSPTTSSPTTSVSSTVASTSIATTSNPTTSVSKSADMSLTKTGASSGAVGKPFNYSVTVDNLGPDDAIGVRVDDSWTAGLASFVGSTPAICKTTSANSVQCDLGSLTSAASPVTIRITLNAVKAGTLTNTASVSLSSPKDPNSSNNTGSVVTRILPLTDGPPVETDVSYRSSIVVEPRDGSVRAQILVNGGSLQATDNSGEFSYTARGHDGVNRVEARLVVPAVSPGFWRFDFGAATDFVSGSFRVESGQVVSQNGDTIVFALGRGAPPPRFTFEIGAGRRAGPR